MIVFYQKNDTAIIIIYLYSIEKNDLQAKEMKY